LRERVELLKASPAAWSSVCGEVDSVCGFAFGFGLCRFVFSDDPSDPRNWSPHAIDPNHIHIVTPAGGTGSQVISGHSQHVSAAKGK
jgi:hypothetical protein